MSAFSDIGYCEDGQEEVEVVPGSVTTDAYRDRLACRPGSVAHNRVTPLGDAAIDRLYKILRERQGRNGRGQSTTLARLVRGCA